ncbi:hypothetical protein AOC36_02935 [Erysipelothrix larvae]|uniref:Wadjet protein JetD C-terminal domain-containing protein n=1 Tax=Erysipelothrix larvae TaxID=1514105 RepID=A0A120JTI5_9FIRM|nr:Wadjet anti-phage system protein JetD domain-containing protein [Erysipelothrix larvae]AMC92972.1 hypothetical protein AOC36_02935 [Erysipelothrix larvae]
MEKTTPNSILNVLVDKYESSEISKKKSNRNIAIKIKMVNYDEEYYDSRAFKRYQAYQDTFNLLTSLDFVSVESEGEYVLSIMLNLNKIDAIYEWLGRTNIKVFRQERLEILRNHNTHRELAPVCTFLIEREMSFKSNKQYFKDAHELKEILKAIAYLETQRDFECTLRQASQIIYGNTKRLEALQGKVSKLLRAVEPTLEGQTDQSIFELYGIVRNPTYIYLKGSMNLTIKNQVIQLGTLGGSLGFSSDLLQDLSISGEGPRYLITVENLDTFHKIQPTQGVIVYLGGFHNAAKRSFLQRIYTHSPNIHYYHFGDIDAGGFSIFQDLIKKTTIPFEPMLMDVECLHTYHNFTRPLTQNDKTALEAMRNTSFCAVIDYMLRENVKLEQEIVDASVFISNLDNHQ